MRKINKGKPASSPLIRRHNKALPRPEARQHRYLFCCRALSVVAANLPMSIFKISFRYHLQRSPGCAMIRSVVSIPVRFQFNPVWVLPCVARHRVLGLPWCIQKSPLRSMKTSSSTFERLCQPTDDPDPSCFLSTPVFIILNGMDLGVFPSKPHSSTVNRLIGGYCDP